MIRSRALVVIAVLGLLLAACSRSGSSSSSSSSSSTTRSGSSGSGSFGTLSDVCGPGSAKGATAQGVTNTSIEVATMADPGASVDPGLDQELFDTATAFSKWCNAAGGILGRKLILDQEDSALFNVGAKMLDACSKAFALVGNGEALDSAGVAPREKCGLPELSAYDNSPESTSATLIAQADPLPIQQETAAGFLGAKNLYPNDTKVGILVGNIPGVTTTGLRFQETAKDIGLNVVYYELYPATGIDNPQADVAQMKAAGVQIFMQIGAIDAEVALEKAMATAGWYPDAIVATADHYDPNLIKNGAGVLKNTWVIDNYWPFELASQSPAIAQYQAIMHQELPNPKIAALGRNAWSAWLLFAQSAKACSSNLTRACLLQNATSQTAWTGGGLSLPVNTSTTNRQMSPCNLGEQATPTGFVVDPKFLPPTPNDGPFNCNPANVVTLKGNYSHS